MPALTDELFTVSEVAAVLKLSEQTIRNWIENGALPALRIGRRVRIKRTVLHEILEHGLELEEDELVVDKDQSSVHQTAGRPARERPRRI
jgi:excisionase family DNA binding protein